MASNGKWSNPVPSQVDKGTGLALQSLSSYLGGWVDDSLRTPIVKSAAGTAESRGNGVVTSQFRVHGNDCRWYGSYALGTTTAWGTGATAFITLVLPVPCDTTTFAKNAAMPGAMIRAYNGGLFYAAAEYSTGGTFLDIYGLAAGARWLVNGAGGVPFQWAATHILSWDVNYPVQV